MERVIADLRREVDKAKGEVATKEKEEEDLKKRIEQEEVFGVLWFRV
jgi:hypothetical protein